MGLHSEHNNWLQTGALADSTELQYTEDKFILNKFPSVVTYVSIYEVRNIYFDEWILLENDKSFIYTDYEVALVLAFWEGWFKQQLQQTSLLVILFWKPIL